MITLRPFYEEDLLEAEMYLAMQEYWDDLGSYWSNSSVEKKIIMMGRFLIPCIFRYLGVLMANGHINRHSPLYAELDSLSDNELIAKLSKLLKEIVKETEDRDVQGKLCYNYEIVV